jgi:hypothetical protein
MKDSIIFGPAGRQETEHFLQKMTDENTAPRLLANAEMSVTGMYAHDIKKGTLWVSSLRAYPGQFLVELDEPFPAGRLRWYRLTEAEYLLHLHAHDCPFPLAAVAALPSRYQWTFVDGAHATAYRDSDGFIWTHTADLRVAL